MITWTLTYILRLRIGIETINWKPVVQVYDSLNRERMGRHGKNQTASAVYGYHEKKKDTGEPESVTSDHLTKLDLHSSE